MRKLGFLVCFLLSITAASQETLYSCGEVNKTDFNGWSIQPYQAFKNVSFANNNVLFKKENGGLYSIEMIRKIDDLIGFDRIYLQLDYEKENVVLNNVTAYFSTDGKIWKAARNDTPTGPFFHQNDQMNDCFVKLIFDLKFFDASSFNLKSIFVQGKYPQIEDNEPEIVEEEIEKAEEIEADFYKFFAFQNYVNIETNSEKPYEVMILNMTGQVVHRAFKTGSNRVELNSPSGFYIIGIIADSQFVAKKKVYISSP